jgi:hypothetical protein
VQRARYTALSPDFGALVGFCEQRIGWTIDYSAYHDAIQRLEENDEGLVK